MGLENKDNAYLEELLEGEDKGGLIETVNKEWEEVTYLADGNFTLEALEECLSDFKKTNRETMPSMFCGRPMLKSIVENEGIAQLRLLLEFSNITTTADGWKYLQEIGLK